MGLLGVTKEKRRGPKIPRLRDTQGSYDARKRPKWIQKIFKTQIAQIFKAGIFKTKILRTPQGSPPR